MPTFYMQPSPKRGELTYGVIADIIAAYQRWLPTYGWLEVEEPADAELRVGHLGTDCPNLDVFHCHGLYPTGTVELPKLCYASNATVIDNMRRARYVVAPSEWVADMLRRDMRMSPFVLPHGIDLEMWAQVPAPPPEYTEQPYVLWNKATTLGVCDPTPVLELAKRLPSVHFVTTYLPKGASVPPNVRVTGELPRAQMWPIVKGAAVYLATTKETFGVGVLEAMASRVPVVTYDWGAVPHILPPDAHLHGMVVQPNDVEGLVHAVEAALDVERGRAVGEALAVAVARYNWPLVVKHLSSCYESCIQNPLDCPLVSIVIPCYNYGSYVDKTIASVLAQTFDDLEVLVVDDGSTDNSISVIKDAIGDDNRARLITQPNSGVSEARNNAIRQARGRYICCIDADDMMDTGLIAALVPVLENDHRLAIAYSGMAFIDKDGELQGRQPDWPVQYNPENGMGYNQVPTCCLFQKEWWERCGGYKSRFLSGRGAGQEDGDLWFNILAHGGGATQGTTAHLFKYRIHAKQATRNYREYWKKTLYHQWYPWTYTKERLPFACQLVRPKEASLPVYDYDRPRIAVVVPVGPYHRDACVDAIGSVVAQTYRQWELIIVNDSGSALNTASWPYAKVVSTGAAGRGPGFARNLGTAQAVAPLVVYLDADDILQPDFLEETLRFWLEMGGGWIYTDFFYIKPDGAHAIYQVPEWDATKLAVKGIAAVTALYPVEAWREAHGFDEELQHEDWDFHCRLVMAGFCGTRLAKPLVTYRHETGQRREEGIRERGFIEIQKRYSKEALMGCGCRRGGGQRSTRKAPVQQPARPVENRPIGITADVLAAQPSDGDYDLVKYIGKSQNDLVYSGRTSRKYVFSTKHPYNWVYKEDLGRLLRITVLRHCDPEEMAPGSTPQLVVARTLS